MSTTRQSDDAYDRIKSDIILGKLAPGSEHTEIGLAETYGMGRAAVRVALTRLSEIGLIEAVPRRGFVVAPITASSIRDLFEARLVIEPRAAYLATNKIDVAALKELDGPLPTKPTAKQRLEVVEANHAFHMAIAEATGNARLCRIIESLLLDMKQLINLGLFGAFDGSGQDPEGLSRQHEHHRQLIAAFEAGDAKSAERIAAEHIEEAYSMARDRIFDRALKVAL